MSLPSDSAVDQRDGKGTVQPDRIALDEVADEVIDNPDISGTSTAPGELTCSASRRKDAALDPARNRRRRSLACLTPIDARRWPHSASRRWACLPSPARARRRRRRRSTGATRCRPAGPASGRPSCRRSPSARSYTRTMTSVQNLEFITALRGKTESLHVVNMFTSPLQKVGAGDGDRQSARDVGAAGARVRQAGRVPVRQHPSAGVGSRRGAADGRARSDRRARASICSTTRSSSSRRSSTSTAPTRSCRRTDRSAARRRTSSACARTPQGSISIAMP